MLKKTAYFLGAGATLAACEQAPTNKDLVSKALHEFDETKEAQNINLFIEEIFKNANPPKDNRIWDLLDYIIQKRKSASPKYNLEMISSLRRDLMNLIIRLIEKSLKDPEPEIYNNFISKIQNTESAIITTNYDILIDDAVLQTGINYGAKIRKAVSVPHKNQNIGLRRPLDAPRGDNSLNSDRGDTVPLLKIHGSLNWLYCQKCDEVDITPSEKGTKELVKGDCYCINENCTNKYEPLLVTPTMYKNYENRIIKEIWDCAERCLIEAENLVFIGYALKEEDYEIRCLLMKSLLIKKEKYKKVVVVERPGKLDADKELKEIEEKYKSLYETVEFLPIGFKEYVKQL